MRLALVKLLRYLIRVGTFFLPVERRVAIERRLRGREEHRKLQLADAVIVSFGKSGRTWLRVMMSRFYQVRHRLPERCLIGFDNLHKKNASVPRLMFTHDNYLKDYTGNRNDKSDYLASRVVLLVRHPGDVAVSQYFQWKFRMRPIKKRINAYPQGDQELAISEFVLGEAAGLPKIIEFMNLWAAEAPQMKHLLLVRYEDMRADPGRELQRILEFLDTPGNDDEIAEAVRFSSVENMRKMEQKKTFWLSGSRMVPKDRSNPDSFKVRRAKVGGFRDYFEDQDLQRVEQIVARDLSPFFGYGQESTSPAGAGMADG